MVSVIVKIREEQDAAHAEVNRLRGLCKQGADELPDRLSLSPLYKEMSAAGRAYEEL